MVHVAKSVDLAEFVEAHLEGLTMTERGLLLTALHTAVSRHGKQRRDSGEPYYTHLLAVENYLVSLFGEHSLNAPIELRLGALLHDLLEDCSGAMLLMLVEHFSARVGAIDLVLTKLDKQTYFTGIVEAVCNGLWETILVKLADRLHNLETIDQLAPERISRKLAETLGAFRECADACRPFIPTQYAKPFEEAYTAVFSLAKEKATVYGVSLAA